MSAGAPVIDPYAEAISLCRTRLLAYMVADMPNYIVAQHNALLASKLEDVCFGRCKRLIVTEPPRHGKSLLVSEGFPAFYFGHHPEHQIMHASYGQELVDDFGRKIRNRMRDDLYRAVFPGIGLADDSAAASRFHTSSKGVYHGVGIGGAATGRGADLLLIDDPIKNREEADSKTHREKLKAWYRSVAYTRLMPNAAIVIVQTRWHEDDLAGWLIEEHMHEGWEVINMPAINEAGEALWPERYPIEVLEKIKATVGEREWEALYMGRPRPPEGLIFKRSWIQFYTTMPDHRTMGVILLVDPASGKSRLARATDPTKQDKNDYTSFWVIGLGADKNFYVLDYFRDKLGLFHRSEKLFQLHRKWRPSDVRYEDYGLMADMEFIRSEMDRKNYRFRITPVGGRIDKESRIYRLIPLFQRGYIYLPAELKTLLHDGEEHDLIREFIDDEYVTFPVGKHDDALDGLARLAEPELDLPWPMPGQVILAPTYAPLDPVVGY